MRIARALGISRDEDGARRLLAIHPLLNPAAYVDTGLAHEDGAWISLCGPEWTGALAAIVQALDPHLDVRARPGLATRRAVTRRTTRRARPRAQGGRRHQVQHRHRLRLRVAHLVAHHPRLRKARPMTDARPFDTILRNGRYFDGTGAPAPVRDVGIRDGADRRGVGRTAGRDRLPAGHRRHRRWVLPGMVDIHTHYDVEVLQAPGPGRVAPARGHDHPARLLLAVHGPRRRRRRRRPVRPGRGDPAPPRHRARRGRQGLDHRRRLRRGARAPAARPEPRGLHRPLRHPHGDDGPGPGHPLRGAPVARRAAADGAMADRGARRRLRRHVRPAAALRQARRRPVPVAHPAVDVRQGPRDAPAAADPARPRAGCSRRVPTRRTRTRS